MSITVAFISVAYLSQNALALGCYGDAGEASAPFLRFGEGWGGTCSRGAHQTPIDIPTAEEDLVPLSPDELTTFSFPTVLDPLVTNMGAGFEVSWSGPADGSPLPVVMAAGDSIGALYNDPDLEATLALEMMPIQFHMHAMSEHAIGGVHYPMELHIVTLVAPGQAPREWGCDDVWNGGNPVLEKCAAVFGVMLKYGSSTPPPLDAAVDAESSVMDEHAMVPLGSIDLQALIPEDKSHWSYYGSLTTPGCNEGLRWHVFKQPLEITHEYVASFMHKIATTEDPKTGTQNRCPSNFRVIQPINGRPIFSYDDPAF